MAKQKVFFFYTEKTSFRPKNANALKTWLLTVFEKEKEFLTRLNYIFCSDDELLKMNQDSLNHDTYTDIITFDLSEVKGEIIGEIYISTDRVKENAKEYSNNNFEQELKRVLVHGALHLIGFNDKSDKEEAIMRNKENEYIEMFHVEQKPSVPRGTK